MAYRKNRFPFGFLLLMDDWELKCRKFHNRAVIGHFVNQHKRTLPVNHDFGKTIDYRSPVEFISGIT